MAARAAARGAAVIGIDVAEAMIERARASHPGIEFRQAHAEDLPFEDGRFDAAVAGFLLLHLARPERVVSELERVLARGGRTATTVWDAPDRNRLIGVMFDAIEETGATPPSDLPPGPPIFRFADESVLGQLLQDAGFTDVAVETVAFDQRFSTADELWGTIMGGAVRMPPLVLGQAEPVQREIRFRFEQLLEAHRVEDGYDVPVSVKLASARRPADGERGRRARVGAGVTITVDRDRLVDTASRMIGVHSFTGDEQGMAELMAALYDEIGLRCQWQQVEDGRANALGVLEGAGGGKSLMFNGHMDTSYSGREPWLRDVPGFQPEAFVRDGRLYGLGISNMKGALACYVEAVRALADAGVRLRGDVLIAAVCGEIEKTQQGDAVGAEYRGYAAGSRYLVSHGGVADMCLLGEPTEGKVVLGHFGALWLRIRVHGDFIHTAFSEGRRDRNAILRQHEVLAAVQEWIPTWEDDPSNGYRGAKAIVNVGAIDGGFGWRVSRTPHHADLFLDVRVPPTKPMAVARREVLDMVRGLAERFGDFGVEGEVYVTAPGAEIEEEHELVAAIDSAHGEVFGEVPGRDVTRWFSDASVLTRYGIPTVNYGTSTGLMDVELGENLEIDGLVRTAEVYARVAMHVCEVA